MLIETENKKIINTKHVFYIWIDSGKIDSCVKCELSNGEYHVIKTCKTPEEAREILEKMLNQYDRGQRVIKL